MKHNLLKAGTIAGLVMAMAAPVILPNVVFAQADIRQEDRQADRQDDRHADRQMDRHADRHMDRQADHHADRGGHGR